MKLGISCHWIFLYLDTEYDQHYLMPLNVGYEFLYGNGSLKSMQFIKIFKENIQYNHVASKTFDARMITDKLLQLKFVW
jgi:hypothetical protein